MAITNTTLLIAAVATSLRLRVTSATGAIVGMVMRVNDEYMAIVAINGLDIDVRTRGDFGGVAVDHAILSPVTFMLGSDMVAFPKGEERPVPAKDFDIVTIGANGAIPLPLRDTEFLIQKGSALATSAIPDPSKAQNGLRIKFVSLTDFAHVVTHTTLHDGTTGVSTTATFAAFRGACYSAVAQDGKWYTDSAPNLVTIT